MTVLLLRLAGPMQSWGDHSRFRTRATSRVPSKSGVLGLLAAAAGRRRTDPIEDLLSLGFGVRVDQPGTLMSNFHTVHTQGFDKPPIVTHREYLADAVFVAGVEGPTDLLEILHECLVRPTFPLYLGRRSCPPAGRLVLGLAEQPLSEALGSTPWQAAGHYRRRQPATVRLRVVEDADETMAVDDQRRDVPVSFDPHERIYGWRSIAERWVELPNLDGRDSETGFMNWFAAMEA